MLHLLTSWISVVSTLFKGRKVSTFVIERIPRRVGKKFIWAFTIRKHTN